MIDFLSNNTAFPPGPTHENQNAAGVAAIEPSARRVAS
jgi:hypothetical protein